MLPTPRIIAIDDKQPELDALTGSLAKIGVSCLGIKYDVEEGFTASFPDVRVIFFDLHLLGDAIGSKSSHFNQILTCLEQIGPQGPYVIIVWSQQAHEADASDEGEGLQEYLTQRLAANIPRPYGVLKLNKVEHITRTDNGLCVTDPDKLRREIETLLSGHAQAKALLTWEKSILSAASSTVSQVIDLSGGRPEQLKSVMASLSMAAVGRKNVDQDKSYALNEVLLPILSDRLSLTSDTDDERDIWDQAFTVSDAEGIDPTQRSRINRFINISESVGNTLPKDRGAITPLELVEANIDAFLQDLFDLRIGEIITRCFAIKSLKHFEGSRWVLLQGQAACDYAQRKPQTLTFFLGLEACPSAIRNPADGDMDVPDSLWQSPEFFINGQIKKLLFNSGAMIVLPYSRLPANGVLYRMREQILNDLLFKLRGHQSRPGIVYLA